KYYEFSSHNKCNFMQAHVFRACICIINIFIYCENKIPKEFFL
ncbi:hypothetical protein QEG_1258, partial [Clostridioides difficile CD127]